MSVNTVYTDEHGDKQLKRIAGKVPHSFSGIGDGIEVDQTTKKLQVDDTIMREPSAEGTNGQVLMTDGNGGRSWGDAGATYTGKPNEISIDSNNEIGLASAVTEKLTKLVDVQPNAGSHNSIYVEKDITEYFTDGSIWDRIAGTNGYEAFEGIFPGETFSYGANVHVSGQTGTNQYLVLGCNMNHSNGLTGNYITVCPLTNFGTASMNTTNTTVDGYAGSNMNTAIIGTPATSGNPNGTINQQLYSVFGSHLKTFAEYLSTAINTETVNTRLNNNSYKGGANSWASTNVQAVLMSEVEVYGSVVFGNSGYDVANAKAQFPAFRNNNVRAVPSSSYWLKDIVSSSLFCFVGSGRFAYCSGASSVTGVRPRFVIS